MSWGGVVRASFWWTREVGTAGKCRMREEVVEERRGEKRWDVGVGRGREGERCVRLGEEKGGEVGGDMGGVSIWPAALAVAMGSLVGDAIFRVGTGVVRPDGAGEGGSARCEVRYILGTYPTSCSHLWRFSSVRVITSLDSLRSNCEGRRR